MPKVLGVVGRVGVVVVWFHSREKMQRQASGWRCQVVIRIARRLAHMRMLKQRCAGRVTCGRRAEGDVLSGEKKTWRFGRVLSRRERKEEARFSCPDAILTIPLAVRVAAARDISDMVFFLD